MAAAKGRKLKVFQAPFGFHELVVAAPSQAAALRAWGTHQNLFAEGLAKIATDAAAIAAALEHPETPLRRAIGSNDPFELKATSLPDVPDSKPNSDNQKPRSSAKKAKPAPPPPDRSELDAAERDLQHLEGQRRRDESRFDRRLKDLHREEELSRQQYASDKDAAERAVKAARRVFRQAGGTD